MSGILYVCATPIGNLEDITLRVLRLLKEVDVIAAEDTRQSIKLLNYFQIKTPLTSYHEYNKVEKAKELVSGMREGKTVALITDAGTPAISDPGEELVRQCYQADIPVYAVPGAAACIAALVSSGQRARRFCFEAFLPSDKKARRRVLEELKEETRTIVLYEAPHHLKKTVEELLEALGDRDATLCRELTKKHEEKWKTTLSQIKERYEKEEPKGEIILVISGKTWEEQDRKAQEKWKQITVEEHMAVYLEKGIHKKEAMKLVAKDRGISKREIYQEILGDSTKKVP